MDLQRLQQQTYSDRGLIKQLQDKLSLADNTEREWQTKYNREKERVAEHCEKITIIENTVTSLEKQNRDYVMEIEVSSFRFREAWAGIDHVWSGWGKEVEVPTPQTDGSIVTPTSRQMGDGVPIPTGRTGCYRFGWKNFWFWFTENIFPMTFFFSFNLYKAFLLENLSMSHFFMYIIKRITQCFYCAIFKKTRTRKFFNHLKWHSSFGFVQF